jgi:hypothetical protein
MLETPNIVVLVLLAIVAQQKKPRRLTGATYRRCYGHGPLVLMSV